MLGVTWPKSLYWRLALGLFAFVALMLAAEGALFLWISERLTMGSRSPRQLAALVSQDVSAALTRRPNLDLDAYVVDQYKDIVQTFFVVLRDGRIAANHDDVPQEILAQLRAENALGERGLRRRGRGPIERPEGERLEGGAPFRRPRPGPGASARTLGESAPLFVNNAQVGRVVVWAGDRPFWRIVRQLGPTMAVIAAAVFGVGAVLIGLVVFGPVRRRLKDVQSATERLGTGDLSARAPVHGGDEVASLARSFNQMADELTARARALEASDRTRRQLMADVSHELMTPLTAMRGYIETLAMPEVQLDPQTRQRYMGIVTDETHRLEQIIGDLLDLARLEGGGLTLRREHVDIAALFDRVAARHERELAERRVRLLRHVDPAAVFVPGDPDRLEQALQNLAANALRHTPDDGEVAMAAIPVAGGVRITLRDNGPGIAPEHLPLIFDRFYKADAARRAAGGSGLGLSIVKAIVERHGGTIVAHNQDGAVFTITLPNT